MTTTTATRTTDQLSGWRFDTAEDRLLSDIISAASQNSQMVREARHDLHVHLGMWMTPDDPKPKTTPKTSPHCAGRSHDTEYLILDLERTCYLFAARIGPPLKKRLRRLVGRFDLEEVENAGHPYDEEVDDSEPA